MVGGDNYGTTPFNLATQGQRQPGSSFKPFVLAEALRQGISPQSTWESKKKTYILKGGERFTVNNYEDAYAGVTTLANATTFSDNSVYAQVGMKVKTEEGREARAPDGRPHAGLEQPRDGARRPAAGRHAAGHGARLRDLRHRRQARLRHRCRPGQSRKRLPVPGPVGIERIDRVHGEKTKPSCSRRPADDQQGQGSARCSSREIAGQVSSLLQTVVKSGTATRAQIPGVMVAGKTGTTENYGDAWFVGWTKEYTVAVWVGYPDEFKPMKTEFQGEPVAGGTYPAGIWKTFMQALLKFDPLPKEEGGDGTGKVPTPTPGAGHRARAAVRDRPRRRPPRAPPPTGDGTGGSRSSRRARHAAAGAEEPTRRDRRTPDRRRRTPRRRPIPATGGGPHVAGRHDG